MKIVLAFAAMVAMATAFPGYQDAIPNGHSVPDPCNPGATWNGVGHVISRGTGDRNNFGNAFAAEGHRWTVALCQADSDHDGKTNGMELGDPSCMWTPDNQSPLSPASSHPGICEPVGSHHCHRDHFMCA